MKHMQRLVITLALAIIMMASIAHAQARTWGFSKDTVYEWASRGDSVFLANSGTDTLTIDSVSAELVRPSDNHYEILFMVQLGAASQEARYIYHDGITYTPSFNPRNWKVTAGAGAPLKGFRGNYSFLVVNKRSAISQNDTVVTRLIFIAGGGRGPDTLTVYSKQEGPAALRSISKLQGAKKSGVLYDLRGRRAEPAPQGVRVPFRPLLNRDIK